MEFGSDMKDALRSKGYSNDQIAAGEKAVETLVGVAATTVAVAGSSVVALLKWDTSPIASTFNWCRKTFFR